MKVFGLTGGVGMGKSTAAGFLSARGIPVIDTDQLARQMVEPGTPALAEIKARFGDNVIRRDGRLDREALAKIVFADASRRRELEAILHPRIREHWQAQVADWRHQGKLVAVVVIPLLFETQAQSQFTETICIACSAATQRERLRQRGWTDEQMAERIGAQLPIEKKMELSSHVVWAEGGEAALATQLERIIP